MGEGDRGRRDGESDGESVVRKVRARNAEREGLFSFPPKEIKAQEEVMGVGTETCLEHLAPPADRIPLFVASDIKMLQEQRSSSQIFFFFSAWETSHPNRPLAFANASSPDKSNSLESAQSSCYFPSGLCLRGGMPRGVCCGGGGSRWSAVWTIIPPRSFHPGNQS